MIQILQAGTGIEQNNPFFWLHPALLEKLF